MTFTTDKKVSLEKNFFLGDLNSGSLNQKDFLHENKMTKINGPGGRG